MAMKRTTLAVGLLVLAVVAAVHAVSEHDILGFVGQEVACSFLVPDAANGDTLYFGIAGAGGNIGSYNLVRWGRPVANLGQTLCFFPLFICCAMFGFFSLFVWPRLGPFGQGG